MSPLANTRRLLSLTVALTTFITAQTSKPLAPLTLATQGSFFIGGHDIHSDALSTLPRYIPDGTITIDQMYVHYQIPASKLHRLPITFIHGCCLTGKTWETTPDGRMGWDEYFLRRGFPVYIVDQADRGRSSLNPLTINAVKSGKLPITALPDLFFVGHEAAWQVFRFGPDYPKLFPGLQFPIEAQTEFWKQMVPDWSPSLPDPNPTIADLSELAIRLNGTILVSHSQSGIFPFQTTGISTKGIAGIIAIEPGSCPDPKSDMKPLLNIPILVLFGDNVETSPRWGPRLKACQAFVKAASEAGVKAELVQLPNVGILGNSHMLMQDKNNLQVADWLIHWIDHNILPR
jgi:hypothetical protein